MKGMIFRIQFDLCVSDGECRDVPGVSGQVGHLNVQAVQHSHLSRPTKGRSFSRSFQNCSEKNVPHVAKSLNN